MGGLNLQNPCKTRYQLWLGEAKINYYFDLARQTLAEVAVPDENKQALSAYMDELLHRNK